MLLWRPSVPVQWIQAVYVSSQNVTVPGRFPTPDYSINYTKKEIPVNPENGRFSVRWFFFHLICVSRDLLQRFMNAVPHSRRM